MRVSYRIINSIFVCAAILASAAQALSADAYYDIPLADLKISDGQLPKNAEVTELGAFRYDPRWAAEFPRIVLRGAGEGYLDSSRFQTGTRIEIAPAIKTGDWSLGHVLVRAPEGEEIQGQLFLPKDDKPGMDRIKFVIPATAANEHAKEKFYEAKFNFYHTLEASPAQSGTAWFRHEANAALNQLEKLGDKEIHSHLVTDGASNQFSRTDAYALFSGGRAVSENLQLDRQMRAGEQSEKPTLEIGSLTGITVATIDWKPLLKGADPKLDPLSKLIPCDQHALFIPSFAAAVKLQEEARGRDSVLLDLAQPKSENLEIVASYQRQLGLSLDEVGKLVGQAAIKSLAVTGSDPYFPTGTDVAVLFETAHPDVLAGLLHAQIAIAAAKQPEAKAESGEIGGVKYQAVRSPERQICSYLAQLQGAVVVTNSLAQLGQLAKVGSGIDPISSLDEFKFFRTRYPLNAKDETAFLLISDPTIRRWCSPRWRIASARRIFNAAILADLTADNAQSIATGNVKNGPLHTDTALIDAGELKLTSDGVTSSTQGGIAWMTPILESPIEKVTKGEADAYNQWRDGYQRNWRWAFDPIGLRIGVQSTMLSGDLTVMPLIFGSDYREFVDVVRGAKIGSDAGDRHDALLNAILAVNIKSDPMREWGNMASMFVPQAHIDPFSWIGSSVSLYLDDDPVWQQLRDLAPEKREEESRKLWGKLPVALQIEVASPLKLTAFLAAGRAFIEQSSPGMTTWEALTYRDEPYVRVKPTERGRGMLGNDQADVALYYAPAADGLIVTLNETVLKHALDRRLARKASEKSKSAGSGARGDASPAMQLPWLGESFCLQVDRKLLDNLGSSTLDEFAGPNDLAEAAMQVRSWSNIPILNQWKRLFPNEDPVKTHLRLWHTTLVCPGGGQYVWNDRWQTMESTVYGHPGQPKTGPTGTAAIKHFQNANFGLTFEAQGLRARVELAREAAAK